MDYPPAIAGGAAAALALAMSSFSCGVFPLNIHGADHLSMGMATSKLKGTPESFSLNSSSERGIPQGLAFIPVNTAPAAKRGWGIIPRFEWISSL